MKRKKLWITLLAVTVLAPTVVLCVLMLASPDFSLGDFADCSQLSLTDSEGTTLSLNENEENFKLLVKILSIAQESQTTMKAPLSARLFTVQTENGKHRCYLGLEDGQTAIEWGDTVYILSYPLLKSKETVMYPRLARYGVQTENGYIDAPILSQKTDFVYAISSPSDFSHVSFDGPCESFSMEILLYEQGADEVYQRFFSLQEVDFDETKDFTIVLNVELQKDGYRVQCGYEFIYSSQSAK